MASPLGHGLVGAAIGRLAHESPRSPLARHGVRAAGRRARSRLHPGLDGRHATRAQPQPLRGSSAAARPPRNSPAAAGGFVRSRGCSPPRVAPRARLARQRSAGADRHPCFWPFTDATFSRRCRCYRASPTRRQATRARGVDRQPDRLAQRLGAGGRAAGGLPLLAFASGCAAVGRLHRASEAAMSGSPLRRSPSPRTRHRIPSAEPRAASEASETGGHRTSEAAADGSPGRRSHSSDPPSIPQRAARSERSERVQAGASSASSTDPPSPGSRRRSCSRSDICSGCAAK